LSAAGVLALTGATGFVGQAVVDEALRRGISVRALARREQHTRPGVEWIRGDLADERALTALVQGASAVLHVAGVVNTPDPRGFHLGNVAGTEALLEATKEVGPERLVFVSSLAAREPRLSAYGRSKRGAEDAVEASGLAWTIVRPPAIYGPRDREILDLFKAARWGIVPMPPGRASIIHVDDLARLLLDLAAGQASDGRGQIYEPDDGRPSGWSNRELAQAIGKAMGRKVWSPKVSRQVLERVAALDGRLRGARAKLTLDRIGYMSHPDWVSRPDKAPPASLWRPRIGTPEGLEATARWYRVQGWL
jgi:UDP-glucose 4-epimerase